jgi:hypothetical protein
MVPALNYSGVKHATLAQCWHNWTQADDPHSEALAIGTLAHLAVLEPQKLRGAEWKKHLSEAPTNPKTGNPYGYDTKAFAEFAEANTGKTIVTPDMVVMAHGMLNALAAAPAIRKILDMPGRKEAVVKAYNPSGWWEKAQIDFAPAGADFLLDVKTTRNALTPFSWKSAVYEFGYHLQASHYLDLWNRHTGEKRTKFLHVVLSKSEPFMARLFYLRDAEDNDPIAETSLIRKGRQILGMRLPALASACNLTADWLRRGGDVNDWQTMRTFWPAHEDDNQEFPEGLPLVA